jgi:hypothetical protein
MHLCLLTPVQKPGPLLGYQRHVRLLLLLLLWPRQLLVMLLLLLLLLLLQLCKLILMLFAVCSSLLLAWPSCCFSVVAVAGVLRDTELVSCCASSCRWCIAAAAAVAAAAAAHMCLKCQDLLLSAALSALFAQVRLALLRLAQPSNNAHAVTYARTSDQKVAAQCAQHKLA